MRLCRECFFAGLTRYFIKQALDAGGYDAAFGGARRDEEKSRAKERVFSFRDQFHRWDPKNQRPELWSLYNGRVNPGESIRVFPISNWTELDVWQYIHLEEIPIVPLYYSAPRPVVERAGARYQEWITGALILAGGMILGVVDIKIYEQHSSART